MKILFPAVFVVTLFSFSLPAFAQEELSDLTGEWELVISDGWLIEEDGDKKQFSNVTFLLDLTGTGLFYTSYGVRREYSGEIVGSDNSRATLFFEPRYSSNLWTLDLDITVYDDSGVSHNITTNIELFSCQEEDKLFGFMLSRMFDGTVGGKRVSVLYQGSVSLHRLDPRT